MGKRGNALGVLGALLYDVIICGGWYVTLFPTEASSTLETVGNTIMVGLGTLSALLITYLVYEECIVND